MLRGIGWPELLIILAIVVLIFGVGKLPEVGKALGKAIHEFRSSVTGQGKEEGERKED
ncbi:MAG TPA: twin-arginine translocase TatA/TatE family subunit [Chloroflexi bacterium]|nr:twin-arginine translocase TatA/TatE family subunit [Chloroflexota bacterium]